MSAAPDLVAEAEEWVRVTKARYPFDSGVEIAEKLLSRLKEFEADKARIEAFVRHKREIGQGGIV
jgi:hypothetical protein